MTLVNAWFLFGLAALAAPLAVHLVAREDQRGQGFPSLMFVRRVPFKARRRRTLRDRPLLALRLLALLTLALAFAHPALPPPPLPGVAPGTLDSVIVLDVSASMAPGTRWAQALAAAREYLEALPSGARAALLVFDQAPRLVAELDADRARIEAALGRLAPGPGGSDFGRALQRAERLLADARAARREVLMISDFQRTGVRDTPLRLRQGIDLRLAPVIGDVSANLALLGVSVRPAADPERPRRELRVRVRNTGGAAAAQATLDLDVDGHRTARETFDLGAGEERSFALALVTAVERDARVTLTLSPDALAGDNRHFAIAPRAAPPSVLVVRNDLVRAAPAPFLTQALALARRPALVVTEVGLAALSAAQLQAADVVILDDVVLDDADLAQALARRLRAGAGLLAVAAEQPRGAWPEPVAAVMPGVPGAVRDVATRIETLDRSHPALARLDPEVFTDAPVSRYREVRPRAGDSVLARYANGAPVLLARSVGRGRALLVTTTLDTRWNRLATQPVYAPLMVELVRFLADRQAAPAMLAQRLGTPLDVAAYLARLSGAPAPRRAATATAPAVDLETPDGNQTRLPATGILTPDQAGYYQLHVDGRSASLAVNVDPGESDFLALDRADFERLVERPAAGPTDAGAAQPRRSEERVQAQATSAPPWQQPGWYLLLATVLLLGAEALLAGRLSRRPAAAASQRRPA